MDYILKYSERYDDAYWGGYVEAQETHDDLCKFFVYDLTQCPEDATIFRDLFSVHDYAKALNTGIELGKRGYDRVVLEKIDNPDSL